MQGTIGALRNILPRYCVRLFLPMFLLCLGAFIASSWLGSRLPLPETNVAWIVPASLATIFTGFLLMNHFLRLFNLALLKGISLFWILGCFARLLPYLLSLALPMAFLVAILVTLGQLSEQGEVMALRASGFSFLDLTWPFLGMAVACSLLLLVLNHRAAPAGFHSFRKQYQVAAQQISKVELQPGSFLRLGPWKLYARRADPDTGRLRDVYLVRAGKSDSGLRVNAREGLITLAPGRSLDLELSDGTLQLPNKNPEKFTAGRFARYRLSVPVAGTPQGKPSLDIPEITSAGLRERIAEPLGLTDTRYDVTDTVVPRRAAGYGQTRNGIVNAQYLSMTQPYAAGSLVSTVDDLAKWEAGLAAGKVVTAASREKMFSAYALANGASAGYGYGWQIGSFEGRAVQEHGGGINGFRSHVLRIPADGVYGGAFEPRRVRARSASTCTQGGGDRNRQATDEPDAGLHPAGTTRRVRGPVRSARWRIAPPGHAGWGRVVRSATIRRTYCALVVRTRHVFCLGIVLP